MLSKGRASEIQWKCMEMSSTDGMDMSPKKCWFSMLVGD